MTEPTELPELPENADATESPPAAITVSDIVLLKNIVEIAASRGAFRANEMEQVGSLYNKVSAWCETVARAAAENTAEPTEENSND